jgi:proteasome lid subunit RPN8/RPN11
MSMAVLFELGNLHLDAVISHFQQEYPLECCGLLVGTKKAHSNCQIWHVEMVLRLENCLKSATEFQSSPESMFKAMRELRQCDWEVLAVYHSHPNSSQVPSSKDICGHLSPEIFMLIIGNVKTDKNVGLWEITQQGERIEHPMRIQQL